jgi:hypothetical protein
VLLCWAFALFLEFMERPGDENIFSNSVFIICIAVIWFNLVSFLFFGLFNNYIARNQPDFSLRGVHYFSNYTYYSLLLFAMLLNRPSSDE